MKTNFTISGKELDYCDIFVGENICDCACLSSKCYTDAHLHIDGASMRKITYKLITHDIDIMGFKDGTVIIVHKESGQINVKKFDIGRKESKIIKICEVYESVFLNLTKPAAGLI